MIQASTEVAKAVERASNEATEAIERMNRHTLELAARLADGDEVGAIQQLTKIRAIADYVGRECIARMLRVSEQGATS